MGEVKALSFDLPWPPSVNNYYRHVGPRVLISRAGRRYRSMVVSRLGGLKKLSGRLSLYAELYPPDRRRRDIDNVGGKALLAAWVLSLRDRDVARAVEDDADGAQRFILRLKGSTALIEEAVRVLTAEAAVTLIPPKPTEEEQNLVDDGIPRGLGWPLEVVESLCANYKMPFEDAMRCEVQRAFALIATCRARCGGEHGGPDYYDRIRMVRWRKDGIIRSAAKGGGDGGKQ